MDFSEVNSSMHIQEEAEGSLEVAKMDYLEPSEIQFGDRGEQRRSHSSGPVVSSYLQCTLKRCLDIAGALMLATAFSPIIVIAILVSSATPGRIFFSQKRMGASGEEFQCLKFRTMIPDAEERLQKLLELDPAAKAEWGATRKLKNDPRITKLGRFLRKTSLDELPQLWNVLRGDMSLVGPRPVVSDELDEYGRGAVYYLAARPGLTGLWQVSGRNDVRYGRRIALDRAYVGSASLLLDLKILLKTIRVVLFPRGAY